MLVYALTITLACTDWIMSLDPTWYSTIFGMFFMISEMLSVMALMIVILCSLRAVRSVRQNSWPGQLHDYGKLMLTFTMVWAYFSFSQWLIIWAGNLPEEITWYLDRIHGGWQTVALALVFLQFSLPFLLLLSRELKRDARKLVPVALLVLVMRYVDLYWLVAPNPFPGIGRGYPPPYLSLDVSCSTPRTGQHLAGDVLLATRQAAFAGRYRTDAAASLGAKPWPLITNIETATSAILSVEFDKSDLSARGILIFFFVLAVFAVGLNLTVIGLYVGMTKVAERHDTELSPLAPKTITPRAEIMTNTANVNIQRFPEPRLQNDDTSDMTKFLAKETEALTAQPWQGCAGQRASAD